MEFFMVCVILALWSAAAVFALYAVFGFIFSTIKSLVVFFSEK